MELDPRTTENRTMRFLILASLTIAVLAVPAYAQGGGRQLPPGFQQEELQKLSQLEAKIREAFENDDYAGALPALQDQIPLIEKAIERVKAVEVDSDEKEKAKQAWVDRYTMQIAGIHYNTACCYSMTDKPTEAIAALKKSIELGYMELDHMKMDNDLDPIRELPEYKALIAGLTYNEVYEVYKPEGLGEEPATAMLVVLHKVGKTGGTEKDDMETWKAVADKAKILLVMPRGPITMGPGKYSWQRTADDEDGALKKIKFTIEDVKKKQSLGDVPVYLLGVGQGGKYATLGAFKMPKLVKGAIQINAYWNKYYMEEFLPGAKKAGTKVCLIYGKEHAYYAKGTTATEQLEAAKVPAKMISFEGKDLPEDAATKVKLGLDFLRGK
jgi:predicted esterase